MKEKICNFLKTYKVDFLIIIAAVIIAFSIYERPKNIPEKIKNHQNLLVEKGTHDNLDKAKKYSDKEVRYTKGSIKSNRTLISLNSLFKEKIQKEEKEAESTLKAEPTLTELIFGRANGKVTLIGITGKEDKLVGLLVDHRGRILSLRSGNKLEGGALVVKVTPTSVLLSFQGKKKELKLYEERHVTDLTEPSFSKTKMKTLPLPPPPPPPPPNIEFSPKVSDFHEPTSPSHENLSHSEKFRQKLERFSP